MSDLGTKEEATGAGAGAADDRIVGRHRGLVRRAALVSGLTFLSRILGFVREVVSAMLFGDRSGIYDAFITAWRVPNLFRRFLGEGALSTSLQTTLTEVDGDEGELAGRRLFLSTLRLVFGVLVGVCAVSAAAVSLAPDEMPFTGWRWLGADPGAVRELCVRLMPYVVLVCVSALCAGALQVRGHFVSSAVAPAVMNVLWIGALVLVGVSFGWEHLADEPAEEVRQMAMARWLAWGVLAAGAAQLTVQVPALVRHGLIGRMPPATAATRGAGAVLWTAVPLAVGAAVYQINVMVDGFMAEALLADGGPTAHYLANRVQQFPLALIAVAATSSVFPSMKALGHRGRVEELRALHDRAQLGVCFLAIPSAAGLFVLAGPMSAALFEHGAFGAGGVERVAAALRMLALALVPAGAVGLTSRAYYSRGDFKTPVRISVGLLLVNPVLNLAFVSGLGMDADGLALATALTTWANLLLLLPGLARVGLPKGAPGRAARLARVGLAAALATGAAAGAHALVPGTWSALAAAAGAGIGTHLLAARFLGVPEAQAWLSRLFERRASKSHMPP